MGTSGLRYYFVLFFLFWGIMYFDARFVYSQKRNAELEANGYYEIGDYYTALSLYQKIFSADTTKYAIALRIGVCKFYLKQPADSILPFLQLAIKAKIPEAYYYLGKIYHLEEKFDEELWALNHYLNLSGNRPFTTAVVQREIELAKYAKEAVKNPVPSTVENMGGVINSSYADYVPLLTADEDQIFFTSRRAGTTGGQKDELGFYFEDIYSAKRNAKGWGELKNLGSPVNTNTNDACTGLSLDGHTLIIYRTQPNKFDGDLYYSNLLDNGWSEPVKFNTNINSPHVETSACISLDEQTIYFSSNRPGGQGGKDIYLARKLPTGEWSKPINLGPTINTPFDEDAPFIHPDNKTLYFSSKGHNTIGGYDVFFSVLDDEGLWTIPTNLGYPINTTDDDIFFVLSPDGQRGYISGKRKDSYGSYDIYKIDFKGTEKKQDVLTGIITEEGNDKRPVKAKLTLIDEDSHTVSGIFKNNSRNGKFILLFNPNKHYKLIVEAEGYNPIVRSLDGLEFPAKEGLKLVLMMSKK